MILKKLNNYRLQNNKKKVKIVVHENYLFKFLNKY